MRASPEARVLLAEGLAAIREQFDVPAAFDAAVVDEARRVAAGPPSGERRDLTMVEFQTLDPAESTDLDQAFAVSVEGDDVVLQYAIADVAAFVEPGSALDREAWSRGTSIYMPDGKVPVYPPVLSEAAASLLPDGPRPAVVLTVRVDGDGHPSLQRAERAWVRSRAKLAYDAVSATDLPAALATLASRMDAAEDRRGAARVDLPEQEVVADPAHPGCVTLHLRPRLASEELNAMMSLAANLAVAEALHEAGTGLFRVQPDPDRRERRELREQARGWGIDWSDSMGLRQLLPRLNPDDPRHARLVMAIRRASGGASYEPFQPGRTPWHSAMAATYAHATAPLRRLGDRHVLLAVLAVAAGDPVPGWVAAAFEELPDAMRRAESRAAQVERAAVDLVEAIALAGREGEEFPAVVLEPREGRVSLQLVDPPVVASVETDRDLDPGTAVRVRLVEAVPKQRRIRLSLVP